LGKFRKCCEPEKTGCLNDYRERGKKNRTVLRLTIKCVGNHLARCEEPGAHRGGGELGLGNRGWGLFPRRTQKRAAKFEGVREIVSPRI